MSSRTPSKSSACFSSEIPGTLSLAVKLNPPEYNYLQIHKLYVRFWISRSLSLSLYLSLSTTTKPKSDEARLVDIYMKSTSLQDVTQSDMPCRLRKQLTGSHATSSKKWLMLRHTS